MASENETVNEIVGEMRGSTEQRYCSSKHCSVKVYNPVLDFADRIKAAYKREVAELQRRLKVAEDALDASLSYNNSEELRKAQRKAKRALATIRKEGGVK